MLDSYFLDSVPLWQTGGVFTSLENKVVGIS